MEYNIGQLVYHEGMGMIVDKKLALPNSIFVKGMQYKIDWSDNNSETSWYDEEIIKEFIEQLEDKLQE